MVWGGGWRPTLGTLLGAIEGCHCSVLWLGGHFFFTLIRQKLVFAIWGLCWYIFFYQIPHLPLLLAAGPFWLACADELRWSGGELDPLGLSLPERQRLSALVLCLSGQLRLRCSARGIGVSRVPLYSFHSPTLCGQDDGPGASTVLGASWMMHQDTAKKILWPKTFGCRDGYDIIMKCRNQYEMHWNEMPLTVEDVIFDMPQEVVGRYQANVEDTVRRSHKRTQRSTHVDRIGNLRMLSHCAGVAPADCPEYSKRPEHNPLVHSLDCCSKFRSLMTVALGVFERNISHVFNECAVFDTCGDVSWHIQQEGIKGNTSWRVVDTSSVERPLTPGERERDEIGHLHNIHLVQGRRGLCHSSSFSSRQSWSYLQPSASQTFNMFEFFCHVF